MKHSLTAFPAILVFSFISLFVVGCASRCEPRPSFREWTQNRPRPVRDWFRRGSECNECNAHAGQIQGWDYAGSDCSDGQCHSSMPSSGIGYYPSDEFGSGSIRAGYPPADGMGIGSGLGTGTMGNSSSNSRSIGELEMPPMYGNGRN